jgi:hypothetical protein
MAAAITVSIFGIICLLVMALMLVPFIAGGVIVFATMVIMYMLIYKILKK